MKNADGCSEHRSRSGVLNILPENLNTNILLCLLQLRPKSTTNLSSLFSISPTNMLHEVEAQTLRRSYISQQKYLLLSPKPLKYPVFESFWPPLNINQTISMIE